MDIKLDEKNPKINLDLLSPEAEKSGGCFLWANIITIQDLNHQIATAFPCNYKKNFINLKIIEKFDTHLEWQFDLEDPSDRWIEKNFLSTTEGLIIFSHDKSSSEKWTLMDGTTVIKNWLQSNENIKTAQLSDAGRISQQVIQSLGFDGVCILTNKHIIKLLNNMSRKQLKSFILNNFEGGIKKSISLTLDKQIKPSKKRGGETNIKKLESEQKHVSKVLIKNKAIKLGMEIKCDKCNKKSWYSLKNLDYSLICDFCLKSYEFPSISPKQNEYLKWAYRVVGPFALPDYAQGGYAVSLSIRFFTDVIGRYNARMGLGAPHSHFFVGKCLLD